MLNRRHIRVKVMQAVFSFTRVEEADKNVYRAFLDKSMEGMYDLYILMLALFVEIQRKALAYSKKQKDLHLATEVEKNPNLKFINNAVIRQFSSSRALKGMLESRKLNNWQLDDEYADLLFREMLLTEAYKTYMNEPESSFQHDLAFVHTLFKTVIAPNEKLHDYLEDKSITWMDDMPLVNTMILKMLRKLRPAESSVNGLMPLFKDKEDRQFGFDLLQKTINNTEEYNEIIAEKTVNWDKDRIALIDLVLLQMAICELKNFPSIPVKVTINEYLEISKEYSTPKSSVFINGILDKLVKEYEAKGTLNKAGRGLM